MKNPRQKRAVRQNFKKRSANDPLVPEVKYIDTNPYQAWAEQTLGFRFNNPSLLVTAFTHRSYLNEHRKTTRAHNERLEFLGDAVLELVTTEFLFKNYEMPEGILTSWRSALVRTESIRDAGNNLGYESLILMSNGERQGTEQAKLHIVANAFEALTGAIYLDQGMSVVSSFIHNNILCHIDEILKSGAWRDPKSYLQELVQRFDNTMPEYRLLDEFGPDHDKTFTIGVFVNGQMKGQGIAGSKVRAQQKAAQEAINTYVSFS